MMDIRDSTRAAPRAHRGRVQPVPCR